MNQFSGEVKLYKSYLYDKNLMSISLQERKSTVFVRATEMSVISPKPSDFGNLLHILHFINPFPLFLFVTLLGNITITDLTASVTAEAAGEGISERRVFLRQDTAASPHVRSFNTERLDLFY